MGRTYFYLKDEESIKKYPFEQDQYYNWQLNIWGNWRMLSLDKRTLRIRPVQHNETIALMCEMYKNGDLIISEEPLLTETQIKHKQEQLEKAKKELETQIEKLKMRYKNKYGTE